MIFGTHSSLRFRHPVVVVFDYSNLDGTVAGDSQNGTVGSGWLVHLDERKLPAVAPGTVVSLSKSPCSFSVPLPIWPTLCSHVRRRS